MASPTVLSQGGIRIAVEGCGHGTLHAIYASVKKAAELKGWDGVDLVIIGGDFQAVRNALDLKAVAMPAKYHQMADFHEYYSGTRQAPYLTTFIGGNHEASNYLWELFYGGWVAPNIYYMGAANVIRLGPLRIAGMSGIWKGYDFRKPHYERIPYNDSDPRSIYHVREWDVRKLLQVRSQVDIGMSHDWPRGAEWKGNHSQLFRFKPFLEKEAKDGTFGNPAATTVLERLRPAHWFSAHMHAKFAAIWEHKDASTSSVTPEEPSVNTTIVPNEGEIDLDVDDLTPVPANQNDAEIDLDLDDDQTAEAVLPKANGSNNGIKQNGAVPGEKPQDVRELLPDSFARPEKVVPQTLEFPPEITNKTTRFLALDKCLPNRHFLQLLEVTPHAQADIQRPLQLEYDTEWLAITRVFANELQLGDPNAQVPADKGDAVYRPLIEKEMEWVEEHVVKTGKMTIPLDFVQTAPVYDHVMGIHVPSGPEEYSNPHTQAFCDLLQIPNPFHASEEERQAFLQRGPRPDKQSDRGRGGGRGGGRGRGRGRGGRDRGQRGHYGGRNRGRW